MSGCHSTIYRPASCGAPCNGGSTVDTEGYVDMSHLECVTRGGCVRVPGPAPNTRGGCGVLGCVIGAMKTAGTHIAYWSHEGSNAAANLALGLDVVSIFQPEVLVAAGAAGEWSAYLQLSAGVGEAMAGDTNDAIRDGLLGGIGISIEGLPEQVEAAARDYGYAESDARRAGAWARAFLDWAQRHL
jgi:hypothetical protein